MTRLYQLHPMTDEPARPDKEWVERNRSLLFYPCRHWRCDVIEPIVLRSLGENVALSFVAGAPGHLIHDDLRSLLNPEFDALVKTTVVVLSDGGACPFKAHWPTWPRGTRGDGKSYCYRCETCGQIQHTPTGNRYLLSCDIPDQLLFVDKHGYIVVREELRERLRGKKLRKVVPWELPFSMSQLTGSPLTRQPFRANWNAGTCPTRSEHDRDDRLSVDRSRR